MVITNELKATVEETATSILRVLPVFESTSNQTKQAVLELLLMSKFAGVKEAA